MDKQMAVIRNVSPIKKVEIQRLIEDQIKSVKVTVCKPSRRRKIR